MHIPRRLLHILVVAIVVLSATGLGAGASTGIAVETASLSQTGSVVAQANATNNTTTSQHENPDTVREDGSEKDIRKWLGGRMASLLEQSSVQISQGQYQRGREMIGDEYNEYLEKYVDVAGSTAGSDSQLREELNQTQESQQEYATLLQQYETTYKAYQEARQNGNETRARELARKLTRLAEQIRSTGGNLSKAYGDVENITAVSLENATQRIHATTSNVSNQTQAVVTATFIRTEVTAQTAEARGSFREPLRITGHVRTTNGTALEGPVTLQVGSTTRTVPLGADGSYAFEWRPRTVPLGQQNVTVTYMPNASAIYLGSNATVGATVEQVEPTLAVRSNLSRAKAGDELLVSGAVQVAERGVEQIPVTIHVGGYRLATTTTASNGTYTASITVPVEVAAGAQTLRATVTLTNRAIAGVNSTSTVQIQQTDTNLTASAAWQDGSLVVTGTLQTATGEPLEGHRLTIRGADTLLTSTTTDSSGQFRVTIPAADIAESQSLSQVSIRFDGAGTSLASAQTQENLTPLGTQEESPLIDRAWLAFAGVLVGGLLVLAAALWWRRREHEAETESPSGPSATTKSTPSNGQSGGSDSGATLSLDAARTQLEAGEPDSAVRSAYAAVRQAFDNTDDVATHWEFFETHRDTFDSTASEELQSLIETYETAEFAPVEVDSSSAAAAVTTAESILKR